MSIKEIDDNPERKNNIKEIVNKVDEIFQGYEHQDILSALITLTTWCIVEIKINTGMELDYLVNKIHEGLSESVKIQYAKTKETSN